MCDAGRAGVAGPAVGPGRGAGGEVGAQEGVQAVGGEVLDPRQADPAGPTLADLDSAGDQQLALVAAPTAAARRVILGAAGDQAFVHFDQARQRHALWCDHGPAQLGGEQPCGLVGTQAELLLELQRRDPVGVRGHQIGGPEPRDQRQLGAVHHRTGRHRGLLGDSRRIHGCMPWSRVPTPGCCRRPDRRSLPASARWPGRRRRLLRLENAVGTPTGTGGSRSFLGIPRVMMFTLCSITTLAPRHHISWSRMLRDKPFALKAYPSGSGRINGWWPRCYARSGATRLRPRQSALSRPTTRSPTDNCVAPSYCVTGCRGISLSRQRLIPLAPVGSTGGWPRCYARSGATRLRPRQSALSRPTTRSPTDNCVAPSYCVTGARGISLSRHSATNFPTSAFGGKADVNHSSAEGQLVAKSGHS